MKARSFWVEAPGRGGLRTSPLAPPEFGEVLIRAAWSGISRGTEATVFHGRVPLDVAHAMRAPFQLGEFPAPVRYGYANAGRVVHAPSGELEVGAPVFVLFPHQDQYVVPAAMVRPVPASVPLRRAVLAANCETALNAVWDAGIGPGDHVTVVGAGVVGCLVAWLAGGVPGCVVTLVDVLSARAPLAAHLGVDFVSPDGVPANQDVVVHASGSQAGLATALAAAGDEAMVVELSWYGAGSVAAPLGGAFHHRRLQLRSSQVGGLPPARRPRWTYVRRLDAALGLLADPRLDALIDAEVPFDQLPAAMPVLTASPGGLCTAVRYLESP